MGKGRRRQTECSPLSWVGKNLFTVCNREVHNFLQEEKWEVTAVCPQTKPDLDGSAASSLAHRSMERQKEGNKPRRETLE